MDLYNIACTKDAFVAYYLELSSGSHKWDVSFIRAAHYWEVDVFALFFKLLYSLRLRRGDEDKFCWPPLQRKGCSMLDLVQCPCPS